MNVEQFRAAVMQEIANWASAEYPTLPIQAENGPVLDEDTVGPVWLDLEIRWYGASTMGIGEVIAGRHTGAISAHVYCREATGTAQADQILDSLSAALRNRQLPGSHIKFPQRTVPGRLKGWYKAGLLFPFRFDEA